MLQSSQVWVMTTSQYFFASFIDHSEVYLFNMIWIYKPGWPDFNTIVIFLFFFVFLGVKAVSAPACVTAQFTAETQTMHSKVQIQFYDSTETENQASQKCSLV